MIASAVDVAAWYALAFRAAMPLVSLLGGECSALPTYNSNGLGLLSPAEVADEAEPLIVVDGMVTPSMRPGNRVMWNSAAVKAYKLE